MPAADAMMESTPPIPWTRLATKDDLAPLGTRLGAVEGRLDTLTLRVDQTSSDLQELTRTVAAQTRSIGERRDGLGTRMDELGRAIAIGAVTVAVTLALFMAGTLLSSILPGALG